MARAPAGPRTPPGAAAPPCHGSSAPALNGGGGVRPITGHSLRPRQAQQLRVVLYVPPCLSAPALGMGGWVCVSKTILAKKQQAPRCDEARGPRRIKERPSPTLLLLYLPIPYRPTTPKQLLQPPAHLLVVARLCQEQGIQRIGQPCASPHNVTAPLPGPLQERQQGRQPLLRQGVEGGRGLAQHPARNRRGHRGVWG